MVAVLLRKIVRIQVQVQAATDRLGGRRTQILAV
jgi:hypothetical protein